MADNEPRQSVSYRFHRSTIKALDALWWALRQKGEATSKQELVERAVVQYVYPTPAATRYDGPAPGLQTEAIRALAQQGWIVPAICNVLGIQPSTARGALTTE